MAMTAFFAKLLTNSTPPTPISNATGRRAAPFPQARPSVPDHLEAPSRGQRVLVCSHASPGINHPPGLLSINGYCTDRFAFLEHRHGHIAARAAELGRVVREKLP